MGRRVYLELDLDLELDLGRGMCNVRIVVPCFRPRMYCIIMSVPSKRLAEQKLTPYRAELEGHYLTRYCPGSAVAVYVMTRDR